ncbi:hypothetical protein AWC11_23175 [Mycobacterium interjectum]|nr:hypothetical protein AWC11_23175 [Mycobacterium interjectum]
MIDQQLDEIRAVFPNVEIVDEADDFGVDIAYLRGLSTFMLDVGLPRSGHLYYACAPTIEDQLRDSLSPDVRRAISGDGWTFAEMWAAAGAPRS